LLNGPFPKSNTIVVPLPFPHLLRTIISRIIFFHFFIPTIKFNENFPEIPATIEVRRGK
jgi:hypothetical protein